MYEKSNKGIKWNGHMLTILKFILAAFTTRCKSDNEFQY